MKRRRDAADAWSDKQQTDRVDAEERRENERGQNEEYPKYVQEIRDEALSRAKQHLLEVAKLPNILGVKPVEELGAVIDPDGTEALACARSQLYGTKFIYDVGDLVSGGPKSEIAPRLNNEVLANTSSIARKVATYFPENSEEGKIIRTAATQVADARDADRLKLAAKYPEDWLMSPGGVASDKDPIYPAWKKQGDANKEQRYIEQEIQHNLRKQAPQEPRYSAEMAKDRLVEAARRIERNAKKKASADHLNSSGQPRAQRTKNKASADDVTSTTQPSVPKSDSSLVEAGVGRDTFQTFIDNLSATSMQHTVDSLIYGGPALLQLLYIAVRLLHDKGYFLRLDNGADTARAYTLLYLQKRRARSKTRP